MRDPTGSLPDHAARMANAKNLIGTALGLALHRQGWHLHVQPGQLHLKKDSFQLNPYLAVNELDDKTTTPQAWDELCRQLDITELPLDGSATS